MFTVLCDQQFPLARRRGVPGARSAACSALRNPFRHAGERYGEFLEPGLREWGIAVSVLMLGLRQGRQLGWLNDCLHG